MNYNIPIVFAVNDKYVPYLGTALQSLIDHASEENIYSIYVLTTGISEEHRKKILSMGTFHISIEFVDVTEWMSKWRIGTVNHLTPEATYRLLIEKIFKNYTKLLYLDCDIIVNHDVAELYCIDIGDNLLGAARAMLFHPEYITGELKLNLNDYFNSGILIFNVEKFAQEGIGEKGLRMLSEKSYATQDQDVLNLLCKNRVKFIDSHWNVEWEYLTGSAGKPYLNDYIKETFAAKENPYIVHYTSYVKPWDNSGVMLADYFWKYARKSMFYEEILEKYKKKKYEFIFPQKKIKKDSRIILYGYGKAGQSYFEQIVRKKLAKLVAVCDKNVEKFQYSSLCVPIIGLQEIDQYNYDYIVISLVQKNLVSEVIADLKELQIPLNKVIWES